MEVPWSMTVMGVKGLLVRWLSWLITCFVRLQVIFIVRFPEMRYFSCKTRREVSFSRDSNVELIFVWNVDLYVDGMRG